jgi:hypothetical protein
VVGWLAKRGSDADVLCAAALNGHAKVIRILVESVGIKFESELAEYGESAVTSACRNGHDETLDLMFELGAALNGSALVEAIRSGSFKCVEKVLQREVKLDADAVELATACGHADVLGLLLRDFAGDVGDAWLIAWLDGFKSGLRVLEAVRAAPAWTASGVARLMQRPGRAADLAVIFPLTPVAVTFREWERRELQRVIARVLREGTLAEAVVRSLVERNWAVGCSPFELCSRSDLERFEIPAGVTRIGAGAFEGCSGLAKLEIPAGVTEIRSHLFEGCSGLTKLEIPAGVTQIGNGAFNDCSDLTELVIPSHVAKLGDQRHDVFAGVTKLARLELVGSTLDGEVVANLKGCLAPGAAVVGRELAGQSFDDAIIVAC